jgi:hypothetical protein
VRESIAVCCCFHVSGADHSTEVVHFCLDSITQVLFVAFVHFVITAKLLLVNMF